MNPRTPQLPPDPEAAPPRRAAEVVVDVAESVAAAIACAAVATLPLWLAAAASALTGPLGGVLTFMLSAVSMVIAPAFVPLDERPELNAFERWGLRVGRFLRQPIAAAEARRAERAARALGSSTSTSSAAAPALPPRT